MKLIFEYQFFRFSEQCYSTTLFTVEYSSKDDLLLDFETACIEAYKNSKELDFFLNYKLDSDDFIRRDYRYTKDKYFYFPPTVYTLEEWFENNTAFPKKS